MVTKFKVRIRRQTQRPWMWYNPEAELKILPGGRALLYPTQISFTLQRQGG
jgi:hypothetical protein